MSFDITDAMREAVILERIEDAAEDLAKALASSGDFIYQVNPAALREVNGAFARRGLKLRLDYGDPEKT